MSLPLIIMNNVCSIKLTKMSSSPSHHALYPSSQFVYITMLTRQSPCYNVLFLFPLWLSSIPVAMYINYSIFHRFYALDFIPGCVLPQYSAVYITPSTNNIVEANETHVHIVYLQLNQGQIIIYFKYYNVSIFNSF